MDFERSQILANFQACTNIDDIAIALSLLEQAEWDLQSAVQIALANEDSGYTADNAGAVTSPDLQVIGQGFDETGRFDPPLFPPSTSSITRLHREVIDEHGVSRRLLNFTADFKDKLVQVQLSDDETVNQLKARLASKLSLDESDFAMVWQDQRIQAEDRNCLRELNLPRENTVHLRPKGGGGPSTSGSSGIVYDEEGMEQAYMESGAMCERGMSERLSINYILSIDIKKPQTSTINHDITVSGSSTVLEAKQTLYNLCGIEAGKQQWQGWPRGTTDDRIIAACNLDLPKHYFTVTPIPEYSLMDSDDEVDVMDDDDIDMLHEVAPPNRNRDKQLIPADVSDTTEALHHFSEEFTRRYGSITHPIFYVGSLEAAVNAALQVPPRERRLLAVYLHHDDSVAANVFCSQVMCSETIVNYLTANYLLWGWDLTAPTNKRRFQEMCERVLGRGAGDYVRRLGVDELPVLIIVSKVRGSMEMLANSSATVTADELMTTLLSADDMFQEQRQQDIREEDERRAREEMKRQQDAEYEASLQADRQKDLLKQQEEEEKRAELERQKQEAEIQEALKRSIAETIPDEPAADSQQVMARLRFRCPDGEMRTRRFLGTARLSVLLDYLVTIGFSREEYKVLTTFPRRDLTQEDTSKTLEELKLCPQETIILEAK